MSDVCLRAQYQNTPAHSRALPPTGDDSSTRCFVFCELSDSILDDESPIGDELSSNRTDRDI
jgi:hypothetical protein